MKDETSYVYVIAIKGSDGSFCAPIKVGMSNSPRARLTQLLTGSHVDMGIVHAFALPNREIAQVIEQAFHVVKAEHRLRGEWFDISPGDALMSMCANIDASMASQMDLSVDETILAWQLIGWPYDNDPYHPTIFRPQ